MKALELHALEEISALASERTSCWPVATLPGGRSLDAEVTM